MKTFNMKDEKIIYCSKCEKEVNYCTDYVSDTNNMVKAKHTKIVT